MKRLLLTTIFLGLAITAIGQNRVMRLYQEAISSYKAGDFEGAIKNYTKLLDIVDEPKLQKDFRIKRGLTYDRIKKYDDAITDFTEAIKLDSTDMASFIDRGLSKMHAGYLDEAKVDYQFVIDDEQNNRMMEAALYWMSLIHYQQGMFEQTIANCDAYSKINPQDPELYFIRGTANDRLMNFEQSINDYTKAIERKSDYRKAYANRGTAKINRLTTGGTIQPSKKETESACADFQRAFELGDKSVEDLKYVYCDRKN